MRSIPSMYKGKGSGTMSCQFRAGGTDTTSGQVRLLIASAVQNGQPPFCTCFLILNKEKKTGVKFMGKDDIKQFTKALEGLNYANMYEGDFFLTWEKTRDELDAVFTVANALRNFRERNHLDQDF